MQVRKFPIGDFPLQDGQILHDAWLSYASWGTLNEAGDNCVLFPTYFTGTHLSNARMVGEQHVLDPRKWFIVVPNLIGNGWSISPSNTRKGYPGGAFPRVTVRDNIECQSLLLDALRVQKLKLVMGWSLGAIQAWYWAVLYPEKVENLLPVCGASRCWPYNRAFIGGVRAALLADAAYAGGAYRSPPIAGLKAFARAYMPWAYSADFFREQRYRELGFETVDALAEDWEQDHLAWDANDLLAKLWTWENADICRDATGTRDLPSALGRVKARTIVMPCDHDQYFTLEENRIEASLVPGAELRPIRSSAGHCAGAPDRFATESQLVEQAVKDLLYD